MLDESNRNLRLFQTFAARIVLEVFGGGGAIWGFSEAATFRNPETQEYWRFRAQVVGGLFFIRFILQIIDFRKSVERNEKNVTRMFQVFLARLVLEVFGGGGAIWGASEAATLRVPDTQEFWRKWALSIGFVFFCRFSLQIKDFISEMNGDPPSTHGADPWVRFFQIFGAKLVLEVFGGCGAIWGFSEVLTLRNSETVHFWRFVALTVGFCFYIRYLLQMKDYVIEVIYPGKILVMTKQQKLRLFQIFGARLVLEVFGGGGAVWGFSEALTLRRPETQEFWRFWALLSGFTFSLRFAMQIKDYLLDIMEANNPKDPEKTELIA